MSRKKYVVESAFESISVQKIMQIAIDVNGRIVNWTDSAENIKELNSDYINEHFGQLQDDTYQRGLNDAWEAARKIALGLDDGGFSTHYLKKVFGSISFQYAFRNYSASEAIEKIKAYEEKQKTEDDIKVGDEVTDIQSGTNFLVTHLWESNHGDKGVSGFNNDCSAFSTTLDKVSKTGRHFDIDKILDEMKRED